MATDTAEIGRDRRLFAGAGAIRIAPKDITGAEVFIKDKGGVITAMGFSGKRRKPDFNYIFKTPERREEYVEDFFNGLRKRALAKAERAEKARNTPNPFKVGDILYNSWGYEQTNVEFYQVIKRTDGTITIREIAQKSEGGGSCSMSDYVSGIKDAFLEDAKPIRKQVRGGHASMKHGSLSLWDGRPKYTSSYA